MMLKENVRKASIAERDVGRWKGFPTTQNLTVHMNGQDRVVPVSMRPISAVPVNRFQRLYILIFGNAFKIVSTTNYLKKNVGGLFIFVGTRFA